MNLKASSLILLFVLFISCNNSSEQEKVDLIAESIHYSTDTLLVLNGQSISTSKPELSPKNADVRVFRLSSNYNNAISIDSLTGVVSVSSELSEGYYTINLELENKLGSVYFSNVFTIFRRKVEFFSDIKAIFNVNCTPCHVFGTTGNWLLYDEAKANIDAIILRSITNSDMPPTAPLDQTEKKLILQWKLDGLLE